MSWRLPFTVLVFGTILVAVYIMYLTERNKTNSANYRRQEGRFKPKWDRTPRKDPGPDSPEGESGNSPAGPPRRRIRIRR